MKCPKCGKFLNMWFNNNIQLAKERDYEDVDFRCEDGHHYFIRIKPDDLIEVD